MKNGYEISPYLTGLLQVLNELVPGKSHILLGSWYRYNTLLVPQLYSLILTFSHIGHSALNALVGKGTLRNFGALRRGGYEDGVENEINKTFGKSLPHLPIAK